MGYIQTIFPTYIPQGYYDQDNVEFLQHKICDILKRTYKQSVIVDKASIVRVMQRVHEERLESIPKMNQRVIMYVTNSFNTHQLEATKHLRWAEKEFKSRQLITLEPDDEWCQRADTDVHLFTKNTNRLGKNHVGGTLRFYST